jgi:membrane-associated phospholipid phosphatase
MAGAIAIWPLKRIRIAVLVLVAVIVLTVLYLDVHWPLDVIVGVALGAVLGLGAVVFVEKWETKKELRQSTDRRL